MRKIAMSAVALLTAIGVLETLMPDIFVRGVEVRKMGFEESDLVMCMLLHQCCHIRRHYGKYISEMMEV